ncbi:ovochymase-2-like [Cimex lectularius]|uniref:Peptidase S1 domain-containing protein n=1 Tax=Cimex lectularius TaxID=79782 RepID=A0A8I6SQY9_CIMLE|nr:ovochymase-2-like [Cimex lectularius]
MLFISTEVKKIAIFTLATCNLIVNVQCKIRDEKIIGGRKAYKTEGLFMASFQQAVDGKHICGATLYSPSYLLTSCKCISEKVNSTEQRVAPLPPYQYQVSAGSKYNFPKEDGYVTAKVEALYQHPECRIDPESWIWINNLGIIYVEKPFEEGQSIKFISFPSTQSDYTRARFDIFQDQSYRYNGNKMCDVFGWGCIRYNKKDGCFGDKIPLRLRKLQLITPEDCQENLCQVNGKICKFWPYQNNAFCAYVHIGFGSLCRGDGGSPFVCNNVMLGVASWNYNCSRKILVNIVNELDLNFMKLDKSRASCVCPIFGLFFTVLVLSHIIKF